MSSEAPVRPGPVPLSEAELQTLIGLARRAIRGDVDIRRQLNDQRVNIVPAHFYSDIPTVREIESSFEFLVPEGPYNDPRVFDSSAMGAFLKEIDAYADEFAPPEAGDREDPAGYFWGNPAFSFSDAMAYYCVLRHLKPKTIVEIGCGFSTLIAMQAIAKNGHGRIFGVEPYPMPWLTRLDAPFTLVQERIQDLPVGYCDGLLEDGDVLFIDSTHTVKAGSDCLHIYLRVLPSIRAKIMAHAHDIYLPFPMARAQFDRHVYWTEQYLLYAFLLGNPGVQVAYGSVFHYRFNRDALDRFMRGRWRSGGGSFWWRQEMKS